MGVQAELWVAQYAYELAGRFLRGDCSEPLVFPTLPQNRGQPAGKDECGQHQVCVENDSWCGNVELVGILQGTRWSLARLCRIPRPLDGITDRLLGEIKFRELRAHGVGALDANWSQYYLAVPGFDFDSTLPSSLVTRLGSVSWFLAVSLASTATIP